VRTSDLHALLEEVRADLTDGQDLALAAQLVSDALNRRVRRVRRTLRDLRTYLAEHDGADVEEVIGRIDTLTRRTAEFEAQMRLLANRVGETAAGFEDELSDAADAVEESLDAATPLEDDRA
jgi:hypothetical protein